MFTFQEGYKMTSLTRLAQLSSRIKKRALANGLQYSTRNPTKYEIGQTLPCNWKVIPFFIFKRNEPDGDFQCWTGGRCHAMSGAESALRGASGAREMRRSMASFRLSHRRNQQFLRPLQNGADGFHGRGSYSGTRLVMRFTKVGNIYRYDQFVYLSIDLFRYPVRDPFFKMLNRSLSTFMNAMTGPDYTLYPYATQNKQDFYNLMSVYLDAVFKPNLSKNDFLQEGWRLDVANEENPDKLMLKGVVFNEMKGAFADPQQLFARTLMNEILPSHTYGVCSGGLPEKIPDLTWENLKKFHASHYCPDNAKFYTYGDMPLEEHLVRADAYMPKESQPKTHGKLVLITPSCSVFTVFGFSPGRSERTEMDRAAKETYRLRRGSF